MRNNSKPQIPLFQLIPALLILTFTLLVHADPQKNAELAERPTGEKMIPPPKAANDREQIEKCLKEIFVAQASYFAEHDKYAGNRRTLSIYDEGYCRGLKLNFKNVKADSYEIMAESATEAWVITESKELRRFK